VNNSLRDIQLAMDKNWPECAKSISISLFAMVRFQQHFKDLITRYVSKYNLQEADLSVLVTLRRSPQPYCLSPTELYKSMLFSSGGLTKVLKRLAELDLIERLENKQDKRSKLVQLSDEGRALAESLLPQLHQQQKALFAGLSEEENLQLESLLQKALTYHEQ
jgi:DNA-binding MarR family transcriptional regulator